MNRRLLLKMLAAVSLSDLVPFVAATAEDQVLELDCTDLLARIRDGSLRAERVCETFLRQYERLRSLNVITYINPSHVLSCARDIDRARDRGKWLPALAGLPILVKDNIDTVGFPTSAGTVFLKHHLPRSNAPVVERLLQQGAILMGKANMHELALGVTSSNPTFGSVHNPYNPALIAGGSSGGSAAAIAARIVPAALGTDTGGSVRIPAAFCGIVGFRPSTHPQRGYSQEGVVPNTLDFDTIGPMGRTVTDVAMLHATIVGQRLVRPRSLHNMRIGVPRLPHWSDLDAEVERVAEAALTRLRDGGVVLVEIDMQEVIAAASKIAATVASAFVSDLEDYLRTQVPSASMHDLTVQITSRDVRAILEGTRADSPAAVLNARGAGREAIRATYRGMFRQHDIQALVFPTIVLPPPPIRDAGDGPGETIEFNGRVVSKGATVLRNTAPAAVMGAPALSLPAGLTRNGLPVALEFDGLPGGDSALLALCGAAEVAIGRVPPPRIVQGTFANS